MTKRQLIVALVLSAVVLAYAWARVGSLYVHAARAVASEGR